MIPYLSWAGRDLAANIHVGFPTLLTMGWLEIHAFGVLVAIGILVGTNRVRFRGRQLGLSDEDCASLSTWIVIGGFIGAHLVDVVAYQPQAMLERPWILLNPAAGLSSFGGFLGALVSLLVWSRRRRAPRLLPLADAIIYGLATGWFFGRLGCFTAHDHPGAPTNFFLAVRYPDVPLGFLGRHDLGLDEALFTGALVVLFAVLARRPRRAGLFAALGCSLYGPVRFALDFLRVHDVPGADPRYFGLTPAQYGAVAVTACGLAIAFRIARQESEPTDLPALSAPPRLPQG